MGFGDDVHRVPVFPQSFHDLLVLRHLHALQDLFETLLIGVCCGVQAPLEVLPLGEPCLRVPGSPDVGQPIQHALAVVAGQVDPGEVRELALLCGDDAAQGAEDGQWEASIGGGAVL